MEKSNLESSNSFSLSPCNIEAGRPLRGRVGDGGISVSIDFVHQNNHFGRFRSQIAVVVVYPPRFRSQPCITVFARPAGGDRLDGPPSYRERAKPIEEERGRNDVQSLAVWQA